MLEDKDGSGSLGSQIKAGRSNQYYNKMQEEMQKHGMKQVPQH